MDALDKDEDNSNNEPNAADQTVQANGSNHNRYTHQQLKVVYSQVQKLQTALDSMQSKLEEQQQVMTRRHNQLNSNVKRIATQPVVQRQNAQPTTHAATLMPYPKSLYVLWEKWQNGIGGRKAAKLFTREERGRCKHKFHRRKVLWDKVSELVRGGLTSDVAIDRVYEAYGSDRPVSQIINQMKIDKRNDSFPLCLQV